MDYGREKNEICIVRCESNTARMPDSKHKGGWATLAKPSDPPPPGLVPGGNGVLNQSHDQGLVLYDDPQCRRPMEFYLILAPRFVLASLFRPHF